MKPTVPRGTWGTIRFRTASSFFATDASFTATSRLRVEFSVPSAALFSATRCQTSLWPPPRRISPLIDCGACSLAEEKFVSPSQRWASTQKTSQVDPLAGAENRIVPHGAGLHAAFDDVARHKQDMGVLTAVLDAHDGHIAAVFFADEKCAAVDCFVQSLPFAMQQQHIIYEHGIDGQTLLEDRRGNFHAIEVPRQFGHVPVGWRPLG